MGIITLTTDLGLNDHYVASIKGSILTAFENARIVDISHHVRPFDVSEGAFILKSCFEDFPEGTIHIIGVDSEPVINFSGSDGSFPSVLMYKKHYFISNDNGFFGSFLGENQPEEFWRVEDILTNPETFKFPTKQILLPIAIRLMKGESLDSFAVQANTYKSAFSPMPISEPNLIKGHVVYIDGYGNAITNIPQSLFDHVGKNESFTLYFKREKKDYFIDVISNSYGEVPPGEKVAIFNENGLIEIAINRGANRSTGGAEQLFGLRIGDMIRIEFTPRGSRETLESLF